MMSENSMMFEINLLVQMESYQQNTFANPDSDFGHYSPTKPRVTI